MTSNDQADIETPVQKQLDAYNARDLDAFMECWSEDCQYHEFPQHLLASGTAAVRERHRFRFEEPNLHGALLHRMSVGNLVVDREVVTRTFADGPGEIDVLAMYEVASGKIAKAWFKMGAPRLHPPGTVSMRRAAARDAGAVRALTREAYAKWVAVIGREPRPMGADYDEAVRAHRIDLLYLDGTLVALIEMIDKPDHLMIQNIAVAPAFQGRGFGRKLLAHAEAVAASLGHPVLKLYTNKAMAENIGLYQRTGYKIYGEEPFPGGDTTVHMSKTL